MSCKSGAGPCGMAYALTRECWLDAAGVETFVSHGRADETVPLALGKRLFHRALKAGFSVSKLLKFEHGHGLSKRLLLELKCWIDRQVPDPDWDIRDHLGLESASSQEYTHRGAIESGILPA